MGVRRASNRQRLYSLNKLGKSAATAPGDGISSAVVASTVVRSGHEVVTEIAIDLASSQGALTAVATDGDVIAVSASSGTHSPGYLAKLDFTENGHIIAIDMTCLEVPTGGSADIILVSTGSATAVYDNSVTTTGTPITLIDNGQAWSLGKFVSWSSGSALTAGSLTISGSVEGDNSQYLYLANGAGSGAGLYTAGKYVIRLYGIAVPDDK
jgi:hypothetical protein